jgi:hypothetical protein
MCSTVSWSAFLQTIIILTVSYYSAVLFIFYRTDLIRWFLEFRNIKSKTVLQNAAAVTVEEPRTNNPVDKKQNENILPSSMHELMEDLKIVFAEASGDRIKKPELLLKLKKKVKEYPQIKGTDFETAINRLIESESKERCEIILSTQELNVLWKE